MTRSATFGVAILCFAASCTSTSQVASHFVKSQAVIASEGGTVTVSAADSATLANTSVTIPAGALASNTTITVALGDAVALPTNGQAAGPVADFGPSGTSFSTPATVTLPFSLPSGASASTLEVVAMEDDGTVSTIPTSSLTLDSSAGTVTFQVTGFTRFGCVVPPTQTCPTGEFFCGCPGYGGECVSDASQISCNLNCPVEGVDGGVCPAGEAICCGTCSPGACPNLICPVQDAGSDCPTGETYCACLQACEPNDSACPACEPLDGGAALCPPGETPCCPGDASSCQPAGLVCSELPCPVEADAGSSPNCPAGDYFCGCPGYGGTCIPDKQACDLNCPVEGVDAGCAAGSTCGGGGDAGTCPTGQAYCCGVCEPLGMTCDSSCGNGCPAGEYLCACPSSAGTCIPDDQACNLPCPIESADGGSAAQDAGACPVGDFLCGCPGFGGSCDPLGTICNLNCPAEGADAGS